MSEASHKVRILLIRPWTLSSCPERRGYRRPHRACRHRVGIERCAGSAAFRCGRVRSEHAAHIARACRCLSARAPSLALCDRVRVDRRRRREDQRRGRSTSELMHVLYGRRLGSVESTANAPLDVATLPMRRRLREMQTTLPTQGIPKAAKRLAPAGGSLRHSRAPGVNARGATVCFR